MPDIPAAISRLGTREGGPRSPSIRGFLPGLPRVGAPLILYAPSSDGSVARMITSIVQRVLMDPDGALFVETRQSVYRLALDEPIVDLPPPLRVALDGFELTVASDSPSDDGVDQTDTHD